MCGGLGVLRTSHTGAGVSVGSDRALILVVLSMSTML